MISRPFNKTLVVDDNFIKFSQTDRLFDEIHYYYRIQNLEQKNLFAEFRGEVSDASFYGLKLKYYNYKNLYESLISGISQDVVLNVLLMTLDLLHNERPKPISDNLPFLNVPIFIEKTEKEFLLFRKQSNIFINHFINKDSIKVNGIVCKHFEYIWPQIKSIIKNNYSYYEPSIIHGDFCLANILWNYDSNNCILIDPRGSYQIKGIYGDPDYDLAKLLHSLDGNYEQIIYDHYDIKIENDEINFIFKHNFIEIKEKFILSLDSYRLQKIKLIEGLLFISMCSRHYDNEEHQFIMYCTGLRILNEFITENQSNF